MPGVAVRESQGGVLEPEERWEKVRSSSGEPQETLTTVYIENTFQVPDIRSAEPKT